MSCTITDIGKVCGRSRGSLRELRVIMPDDVEQSPVQLCCPVVSMPVLKNGKRYYIWRFDTDAAGMTESPVISSRHGDYFEQKVGISIKYNRVELTRLAAILANKRVHLVVIDYNGQMRLVANARMEASLQIDNGRAGYNGYSYTFKARSVAPAPHVVDTDIDGTNDCTDFFINIDPGVDVSVSGAGSVIKDDLGNIIKDDLGNIILDSI